MKPVLMVAVLLVMAVPAVFADLQDTTGDLGSRTYVSEDAEYTYSVFGASYEEYESTLIGISDISGTVFVQSAIEGYPLKRISSGAFAGESVDAVVIPSTVISIEDAAFDGCDIGSLYFLCDRPQGFEAPEGVKVFALEGAEGWKDADVLELGTYTEGGFSLGFFVVGGEAVIHDLVRGTDVHVPSSVLMSGKEYPVGQIGAESFRGTGVESVDIPEGVEKIGVRAFYLCRSLENVSIPGTISAICDEAFRECHILADVDLQDADFLGFESFRMCYGFTDVVIPDSVTGMGGGAFYVCSAMESLTVGKGVTYIADRSFGYAPKLTSLDIRGSIGSVGDYAFYGCSSLESVSFPDAVSLGDCAFRGCEMLFDVCLSDGLEIIGRSTFEGCLSLPSVRLPDTVGEIGDMAFYNCRSLSDIYFAGDMPEFGEDVFAGTDATVHCTESKSGSWADYSGNMVVDDDGSHPYMVYAVVAVIIVLSISVICIIRRRSGNW